MPKGGMGRGKGGRKPRIIRVVATIRQASPIMSASVTMTVTPGDVYAPQTPTLTIGTVTSTSIALSCNAVSDPGIVSSGVASYKFEGKLTSLPDIQANWTEIQNTSARLATYSGLSASTSYDVRVSAIDAAGNQSAFDTATQSTGQNNSELLTQFSGLTTSPSGLFLTDFTRWRFAGTDSVTGQVFSTTSPQLWGGQDMQPGLQCLGTPDGNTQVATNPWYTEPEPSRNPSFEVRHGAASGVTGLRITKTDAYTVSNPSGGVPTQCAYQLQTAANWTDQTMTYHRYVFRLGDTEPHWPQSNHWLVLSEIKQNSSGGGPGSSKVEVGLRCDDGAWRLYLLGWYSVNDLHPWAATSTTLRTNSDPLQTDFYIGATTGQVFYYSNGIPVPESTGARNLQGFSDWWEVEFAYRLENPSGQVVGGLSPGSGWVWVGFGAWQGSPYCGQQRFYVPGANVGTLMGSAPNSGQSYPFLFNYYTNTSLAENKWMEIREAELRTSWPDGHSYHPAGAV